MNYLHRLLSSLKPSLRLWTKGAVDQERTDSVGYVNSDVDFGFKFLPKSASTTVLHALYFLNHDRVFNSKDRGFGVHKWGRLNSGNLSDVSNRLIIIRDPVKRFLSGYSSRVGYHRELSAGKIKNRSVRNRIKVFDPTLRQFINEFKLYMEVPVINHHFQPISDHLAGTPLSFFSHVVKIENLDIAHSLLQQAFGKDFDFAREQRSKKIPLGTLTYQQLCKITDFYSADYQLLQGYYSKQDIFDEWEEDRLKLLSQTYKSSVSGGLSGLTGYVNEDVDFGFRFMPKSASTSILSALYFLNHDRVFHPEEHGHEVHRWGRVHSGDLSNVNKRLIVIRDPVKRFLSGYSNRVGFLGGLSKVNIKNSSLLNKIEVYDPTLQQFIDEFKFYMQVPTINHHFGLITDHLAGTPLSFYSHVVKIEDLDIVHNLLQQAFGKDFDLTREQSSKKIPLGTLTYQQLCKITDFYSADYKLLQGYYSKQDIFDEWEKSREQCRVEG